jgi:hypothetical protein
LLFTVTTLLKVKLFPLRSYEEIRKVAEKEGVDMDKYGDVLRLHDGKPVPTKSVDDWKADPAVISVTEAGLPPGWAKIVKMLPHGKPLTFFKTPTKAKIR